MIQNITDSESFKFKARIIWRTFASANTKDVEIAVPLKYFSDFGRALEMPQINDEINFLLTWPGNCFITDSVGGGTFAITYTELLTQSTQDNTKLLKRLLPHTWMFLTTHY